MREDEALRLEALKLALADGPRHDTVERAREYMAFLSPQPTQHRERLRARATASSVTQP